MRSEHGPLRDDSAASMNLFGFDESVVDLVDQVWEEWISRKQDDAEDECRLPEVLNELVAAGEIEIDVVRTNAQWMGITYTEDVAAVRDALSFRFS